MSNISKEDIARAKEVDKCQCVEGTEKDDGRNKGGIMTDLSLVPMDDMVDEITKRFDTVVILTRKQLEKNKDDINYHFRDKVGCIGLMTIAIKQISDDYLRDETGEIK
jgi:hypothetical protein